MVKRYSLGFTVFLLVSDILLVVLALWLASQARLLLPYGRPIPDSRVMLPVVVYVMAAAIWLVTFLMLNVYAPKHTARLVQELQKLTVATGFAWLVFIGALYLSFREISRLQIGYFGVLIILALYAHRVAVRGFFKLTGGRSYDARKVLIIGTEDLGLQVADMVKSYAWSGLYLLGFLRNGGSAPEREDLPAPVLGGVADAVRVVEETGANEIVIALGTADQHRLQRLVYDLQQLPVNIRLVPDTLRLAFLDVQVEDLGGMPLLTLKEPVLSPFQRLVKRIFDIVVTSILLIPALPLMGLIALAVRADSRGPAIFRQERIGEHGVPFDMFKFRTMYVDAEDRREEVLTHDEEGHIVHKRPDDPRVTKVGRFLRRSSMDELPQLLNVLKGDMSLVGPRPEMPWLVEKYEMWQRKRFEVPQGMTGWWQTGARANKLMHLSTEEDLLYIRNYSLWLDIQILWRTIGAVISGRGSF